jgi:plasmid stabilization system protein ParE
VLRDATKRWLLSTNGNSTGQVQRPLLLYFQVLEIEVVIARIFYGGRDFERALRGMIDE